MVGKKRLESAAACDALLPLLLSTQLLIHIAPNLSAQSFSSLKVSSRLAFLSTVYSSLERDGEAIILCMLALLLDVVESSLSSFDGDSPAQLLEHFVGSTRCALGSDQRDEEKDNDQRAALVSTLVRLFSKHSRSAFDQSTNSAVRSSTLQPGKAVGLLIRALKDDSKTVRTLFEELCGVAFNLGGVFQAMFTKNATPNVHTMDHSKSIKAGTY